MMRSLTRVLISVALAFTAICIDATSALAQGLCKGSFTLLHEVQWQSRTLPVGVYTFEAGAAHKRTLIRLQGPRGSQFINALVADDNSGSESKLVSKRRTGSDESVVTELYLAEAGLHLRYAEPKPPKDVEVASKPVREEVLVAVNSRR